MKRIGQWWEYAKLSLGLNLGLLRSQKQSFDQIPSLPFLIVTLQTRNKNGTPLDLRFDLAAPQPLPVSPASPLNRRSIRLTSIPGRQTPHNTAARAAASALCRNRACRCHQIRMDLEHCPRQLRLVYWASGVAELYGCWHGRE